MMLGLIDKNIAWLGKEVSEVSLLNDMFIKADIKVMALQERMVRVLSGDDGVETGEIVVALAIFVIVGAFVFKSFGTAFKDKATEIINGLSGTTWTP